MNPNRAADRQVLVPQNLASHVLSAVGSGQPFVTLEGATMGTTWTVRCILPEPLSAQAIQAEIEATLDRIIRQMSHWAPESDLCRFNRAPANSWHPLPDEFFHVLQIALEVAEASNGALDPTVGRLVDLHGFGPHEPAPDLSDADFEIAHQQMGWRRLSLDPTSHRALQPGDCQLDLSSIAKGGAVDLISEVLLAHDSPAFLVEIGGEIRGHGCKPDGSPWWCLLENPPDARADSLAETVVALCGLSLASSGDFARRRTHRGREISHLIDPGTGSAASMDLASVSVLAPTCILADAWATALYIAGPEHGPLLAESHGLAARFIHRHGPGVYRESTTSAYREMLD
ncbi:FAD:protein FMN transferase [Luteolibacter pohnpeiensis]|uniref:FAD:protein FMN transferase n=1 Tax=Luteolibacter pohnpeiensis TaxID=454153 RepID=A0A934S608_9BACT|nr:FAD:protein FMN transferase [Luteolibacter pohnpeiensis]MBK1883735.1 FAD:protein FMN transferase [Luteolibacter pohnpeiensis]